jgi:hypothetical protein
MTTITWKITNMLRNANDGAVTRVGWEAVASNAGIEVPMRGAVSVTRTESFTPFEQLTEEQVLAWVKAAPETATVEAALTKRVGELVAHVAATASGLPWAVPEAQEAA